VSIRDQPEAAANTSGIVAEQSRDGFTCCTSSEQRFCRLEAVRSMNLLEIDPEPFASNRGLPLSCVTAGQRQFFGRADRI